MVLNGHLPHRHLCKFLSGTLSSKRIENWHTVWIGSMVLFSYGSVLRLARIRAGRAAITPKVKEQNQHECIADIINIKSFNVHILEISLIQKIIRKPKPDWMRRRLGMEEGHYSYWAMQNLQIIPKDLIQYMNAEIGITFLLLDVDQLRVSWCQLD